MFIDIQVFSQLFGPIFSVMILFLITKIRFKVQHIEISTCVTIPSSISSPPYQGTNALNTAKYVSHMREKQEIHYAYEYH